MCVTNSGPVYFENHRCVVCRVHYKPINPSNASYQFLNSFHRHLGWPDLHMLSSFPTGSSASSRPSMSRHHCKPQLIVLPVRENVPRKQLLYQKVIRRELHVFFRANSHVTIRCDGTGPPMRRRGTVPPPPVGPQPR